MLRPWIAEEQGRQATLVKAVAELSADERSNVGAFPTPLRKDQSAFVAVVGWWMHAGYVLGRASEEVRVKLESCVGAVPSRGQYPPLWLAAQRRVLHFPPAELPAALAGRDAWKSGSDAIDDYLWKLLTWVSDPHRPRFIQGESAGRDGKRGWLSLGWKKATANRGEERLTAVTCSKDPLVWIDVLEQEFHDLASRVSRLFGPGVVLKAGGRLSSETVAEWLPFWLDPKCGIDHIRHVRDPIVSGSGGGRVHLKGLAVLAEPGVLMRRLAQALANTEAKAPVTLPPIESASRALRAVVQQCKDIGRLSKTLLPLIQKLRKDPECEKMKVFEALIPLLRLLVATAAATRSNDGMAAKVEDPWSKFQELQLALALDGFELRPIGARSGDREIPHRGQETSGPLSIEFVWEAAGVDVRLGVLGKPASCDEALLAAIETVDWRLWALKMAPWNVEEKKTATALFENFRQADWESVKTQTLRSADDSRTLGEVFAFMHCRRLDLERIRRSVDPKVAEALNLDTIIAECRDLEQLTFAVLVAKDAGGPAQLDVPRVADTGVFDVVQWFSRKQRGDRMSPDWRVEWVPDARPVGEVIDESRAEKWYVVRVSAGSIEAADLALLGLEPLEQNLRECETSAGLATTLTRFQSGIAADFAKRAQSVDVYQSIDALRADLASERTLAFHDLVECWKNGDESVGAWLRALAADPRFRFSCHPSIDFESRSVARAAATDPFLAWAFDESVPRGDDVEMTFALDPLRARRVISRGPRVAGSAADLAEAVVVVAGPVGPLAELAAAACRTLDLATQFPDAAFDPIDAASRLLNAVLADGVAPADVRAAVFVAARRLCAALGHQVVPAKWSPDVPVTTDAVSLQELSREFHPAVAAGCVVVRGFGLTGPRGVPFSGAVSAGPAPAGFGGLAGALRDLAAGADAWTAVVQRVEELPKHALADTQRLAASNLYDAFWEAAAGDAPPGQEARVEAAKAALFEYLKAANAMVPFEPSTVGDYPTAWIRESDGKQPRGRRVRRVVRPGLRTMDNSLVRPAIVITE